MINLLSTIFGVKTAEAATATPITTFVGKVNQIVINPLIILMFAVALVYFLYGVVQFIVNSDKADEREIGQSHMLWGIVGMFIMFAVGAMLHIIMNTLGPVIPANPNLPQ